MRLTLLALLAVCLATLIGCSTVRLYPQTNEDILKGDWCKQGWVCMSEDYVKYVMKVKIEEKAK